MRRTFPALALTAALYLAAAGVGTLTLTQADSATFSATMSVTI